MLAVSVISITTAGAETPPGLLSCNCFTRSAGIWVCAKHTAQHSTGGRGLRDLLARETTHALACARQDSGSGGGGGGGGGSGGGARARRGRVVRWVCGCAGQPKGQAFVPFDKG